MRNAFILTGVLAWLGGLGTALAVSSCDVEVCDVDPDDPRCTPEPNDAASRVNETTGCDLGARPSVHVVPVREYDDYLLPVDVDMVWFEHRGKTYEARCIQGDDGCMGAWMAGYELEGSITVSTEYCDTMVSETVEVGLTDDGCHVQTEFVLLPVSTRGCLVDQVPPSGGPPPPPPLPWGLTRGANRG